MKKTFLAILGNLVSQAVFIAPKNGQETMRQFSNLLSGKEISQDWKDKIIKYFGL